MFPDVSGLTSEVPDLELEIFVHDSLDVEADGGDGGDDLAGLQPVEDGRLAGPVQAEDEYPHLTRPDQVTEITEESSHGLVLLLLCCSQ